MTWLKKNRDTLLLLLILLLTAFLTGYKIWDLGDGNAYYTATVKSMLTSWHNFFYASFDPGGFITVDKPALGFWLQCLFGLVFGVHGWSLALPEILSAVISVGILYKIVKRFFGAPTGLLAALFMALTPVFVAATRTNNLDPSLLLVCLLAIWAALAAAEKGSLGHLLLAAVLIGLGFNIKMLQAYLYLPALVLVYFFTAKTTWPKRLLHLALAAVVLLAVSLSWCLVVDLTPAGARPYVGSSMDNSTLGLALGYNGILRIMASNNSMGGNDAFASIAGANFGIPSEGGPSGILRLFNSAMAGQASWLIVLAIFGLLALLVRLLSKREQDKRALLRQLLLWLGLFTPMLAYFSITGNFHRYYLIMLAPPLSALSAIAVTELMKRFRRDEETGRNRWDNLLLPLAFGATAAVEVILLTVHYPAYAKVLVPVIAISAGVSMAGLLVIKLLKKENSRLMTLAAAIGLLGLLAAPAYWAYSPIEYGMNAVVPAAGPEGTTESRPRNGAVPDKPGGVGQIPNPPTGLMGNTGQLPKKAVAVMMGQYNGARYLVAVATAGEAEPIILEYGVGVMTLGGFRGSDKTIGLEDFKAIVRQGDLQYFWTNGYTGGEIVQWVRENGVQVDPAQWGAPGMTSSLLYDLSGLAGTS